MTNIYTHFNFLVFAFYHKYHIKCIYSKGSFHNLLFDVYNIYYAHQISHRHTAIPWCDSHPPFVTPLCRLCVCNVYRYIYIGQDMYSEFEYVYLVCIVRAARWHKHIKHNISMAITLKYLHLYTHQSNTNTHVFNTAAGGRVFTSLYNGSTWQGKEENLRQKICLL